MARRPRVIITNSDRLRLESLLAGDFAEVIEDKPYLNELLAELQRGVIVDSGEVPDDVVTMNSTVPLRDVDTGKVETYTLVFPEQANIAANRLDPRPHRYGDSRTSRRRCCPLAGAERQAPFGSPSGTLSAGT